MTVFSSLIHLLSQNIIENKNVTYLLNFLIFI